MDRGLITNENNTGNVVCNSKCKVYKLDVYLFSLMDTILLISRDTMFDRFIISTYLSLTYLSNISFSLPSHSTVYFTDLHIVSRPTPFPVLLLPKLFFFFFLNNPAPPEIPPLPPPAPLPI